MGILHGQSRCRASDRGAESKINGRKMRSKSRSRELSLKGHFWTPYPTLDHPKDRRFFFLHRAAAGFAFASATTAFSSLALDDLWLSFMAGHHIGFIALDLVG